jgi:hypothetical protein
VGELVDWKANPHRPGTPEFNAWIRAAIRRQHGNAAAEYTAARARVYANGPTAVDVAEQEVPAGAIVLRNGETIPWSSYAADAEALARAMGVALDEAIRWLSTALNDLYESLVDMGFVPDNRAKRRGRARSKFEPLCPSHGQPRGRCRRCWR